MMTRATPAAELRRCLTCGRERPGAEFPVLPLWPIALGGEAAPAEFHTTRLCARCAALARQSVDRGFLMSWFMQAEAARGAQMFLDNAHPAPAPLAYLGAVADFPVGAAEKCDLWSGLAGEYVYHIHGQDESIWTGPSGKETETPARLDQERAILVLTSPSHYWSRVALLSLIAHFPAADKYCLNNFAPDLTRGLPVRPFAALPDPAWTGFIRARRAGNRVINEQLTGDGSHRFLIKLALGLGFNLFGAAFLDTSSARSLRRGFWSPQPRVRSTGYPRPEHSQIISAGDARAARHALHWPGAWTLCLGVIEAGFGLIAVTPNGRMLDVLIAEETDLWQGSEWDRWRMPQIFLAIPQRGQFLAPVGLDEFIAHRDGEAPHPDLARLESLALAAGKLPNKQGYA